MAEYSSNEHIVDPGNDGGEVKECLCPHVLSNI